MKLNIDKLIDEKRCLSHYFCTVVTTGYDIQKREHLCYECLRNYCLENDIEIIYGETDEEI